MLSSPSTLEVNAISIFNQALENELNIRFLGEDSLKNDLVVDIVSLSKTIRLSTLFTKSGLENIVKIVSQNKNLFNFIYDLQDVFSFNLRTFIDENAETDLIRRMATSFAYVGEKDMSLFASSFSDNFVPVEDIINIIKNNRWLIVVVMFRFLNTEIKQVYKTSLKAAKTETS